MTLVTITRAGRGTRVRVSTRCREVTWLFRAIAGVAIMAVAISAADSSFSLVIQVLHCEKPIPFGS